MNNIKKDNKPEPKIPITHKLCYFLAAIGKPYADKKKEWLAKNLKIISTRIGYKIDLFACVYDDTDINTGDITNYTNKIIIYRKPGYLATLWKDWEKDGLFQHLNNYDLVLMILDDVVLSDNFDIFSFINKKNILDVDILSPKINNGWSYTDVIGFNKKIIDGNDVLIPVTRNQLSVSKNKRLDYDESNIISTINNIVEMFAYLMTPTIMKKYLDINSYDNPIIYGIALLLNHFGFSAGICYENYGDHMLNTLNVELMPKEMNVTVNCIKFLNKHNFRNITDILNKIAITNYCYIKHIDNGSIKIVKYSVINIH